MCINCIKFRTEELGRWNYKEEDYDLYSAKFCPECGEPLHDHKLLSWEELQSKICKPIWIKRKDGENEWVLIAFTANTYICVVDFIPNVILERYNYGETWMAYDHELEVN